MPYRVLGVIPARGGSKGISRKNIRLLGGRPLLQYTIEAALSAGQLSRVLVSTEDAAIAELAQRLGAEVPFRRPLELAQDHTPTLPVVEHALRWCEAQDGPFDAVCLLQPTSPFRRAEDIDGSIELLRQSGADAVVTVLPVPSEHNPHWVYFTRPDGSLHLSTGEAAPISRRQDLPPAFHRDGSIYITRRHVLVDTKSLYGTRVVGYPVDPSQSVNLDDEEDWRRAESLLLSGVR